MTLANRITIGRLMLAPVFLVLIVCYTPEHPWMRRVALIIYIIAAISDALDGFVARAYNQKTKLGAVLDPLADKLIINLAFVFMAINEAFKTVVPVWFPIVILSRDAVIVVGSYLINEYFGPLQVRPRFTGKVTTAFQMSLVLVILLEWRMAYPFMIATLIVTLVSFADYVYTGIRQIGNEDTL